MLSLFGHRWWVRQPSGSLCRPSKIIVTWLFTVSGAACRIVPQRINDQGRIAMLPNNSAAPLDDNYKNAYRYLIYWAMLDIRPIEWITHRPFYLLNPFALWRALRGASRAGAIACWLHNLALASAKDFKEIDETWFWREYEQRNQKDGGLSIYRTVFDRRLEELKQPKQPA